MPAVPGDIIDDARRRELLTAWYEFSAVHFILPSG
jgi:hypothetical protein